MAKDTEVVEALTEYTNLSNGNARLRRMNKDWNKVVQFHANDTNEDFMMKVDGGEITKFGKGAAPNPDIVIISSSEVFCDMFWGDLNPTQKYLSGELQVKGTQEDIMRLDAISAVIWPD